MVGLILLLMGEILTHAIPGGELKRQFAVDLDTITGFGVERLNDVGIFLKHTSLENVLPLNVPIG